MKRKLKIYLISISLLFLLAVESAMATVIPSHVKDIVVFIFITNEKGDKIPNGTGFFVGVKNEEDKKKFNVYLVTAKHVLQDENNNYYPLVYIRLNTKEGGSKVAKIPIQALQIKNQIFSHKEPEVDIAVIPCLPDQQLYDFKFLPDEFLITKDSFKKNQIQEGDEIFFTGLFTAHFGEHRNYPIVRFGRVALITEEKVKWEDQLIDLYLVETQSFGGNSGAPVFFFLGPTRKPGRLTSKSEIFLAGIMKGCFSAGREVEIMETKNIPVSWENVGIAAVIPAYKLYEILFSDKLKASRKLSKKVKE